MNLGSMIRRQRGLTGKVVLLAFCFSLLLAGSANANLFLKFDGIDGGSVARGYENWSEVLTVSWGISMYLGRPDL